MYVLNVNIFGSYLECSSFKYEMTLYGIEKKCSPLGDRL